MSHQSSKQIPDRLSAIELAPIPEEPLVSVLVTNHNYGKYVSEAIYSALDQSYSCLEVIVCDDGSTDDSRAKIEACARRDSRVRTIFKENGGFPSALNACYAASQGEIITLLDADDLYSPKRLAVLVEAFQRNWRAGLAINWCAIITGPPDFRSESLPRHVPLPEGWVAPSALRSGGSASPLSPTSCLAFRRGVADRLFPVSSRVPRMVDIYLAYAAQLLTEVCAIREPLTKYRLHGENMTAGKASTGARGNASGLTLSSMGSSDPVQPCIFLAPGLEKLIDELALVVEQLKEFLTAEWGPDVAAELRLEDNPHYWRYLLALYILNGKVGEGVRGHGINEVVERTGSRKHMALSRILTLLPAPVARRLVLLWWGTSGTQSNIVNLGRALLRV